MHRLRLVEEVRPGVRRVLCNNPSPFTFTGTVTPLQDETKGMSGFAVVMRDNTERPEAVTAGTVKLIGTDEERIVSEVSRLVDDRGAYDAMSRAVNPYGDGLAADRSVAAIAALFGIGERLPEFIPR